MASLETDEDPPIQEEAGDGDSDYTNEDDEAEEEAGIDEENADASSDDEEGEEAAEAEAEAALDREIVALRRHLESNPYHYDSHVRLIELLRKSGELDETRSARERMHSLYPLSPGLWLDWINDEKQLLNSGGAAATKDEAASIDALFRRALDDYASVDVAAEYCVFAIGQSAAAAIDADDVRRVFEHCVALVGRFAGRNDQRVWEAWREFEQLELAKCEAAAAVGSASAEAAEANAAALDKQRGRVLEVFRRHLAMPHVGLEATWRELCDWLAEKEQQPADDIRQLYENSRQELSKIEPFENLLADEPEKSAQHYRAYIEAACGSTAQQLAVLERAVTANCLDTGLWDAYVAYVWQQFEPGPKLLRLCQRAVRNCPWSGGLWRQLALCQECTGCDYDSQIRPTFESAAAAGLSDPADLLALWLAYLDAARRRAAVVDTPDCWADWHRLCEAGVAALDAQQADPEACLLRYAALLRARRGELGLARQLWDQVMKRGHGNSAQMWLRQLEFELRFGDAKHIRRSLSRAVNSVSSGPDCELLLQRLVDYEREEGDVSSYVEALKRAQKQRALLQQRASSDKSGSGGGSGGGKRKGGKSGGQESQQPPNKRAKGPAAKGNQPSEEPEFKKPMPPSSASNSSTSKASKMADVVPQQHGVKVEHDPNKDYRTVFLSNLDYGTDEAGIRQALQQIADDIVSIRLVCDYRGRSKGFAYVELKSGLAASSALRLDRTLVNGRPMFVSESRRSDSAESSTKFKFDTGLERNKLFIKNLPKTMDQAAFERLCSEQSGFQTGRLALFRNGAPKGHGYAEFADELAASRALKAMDGMRIDEQHQLEVAISNPPARQGGGGGGGGRGGSKGGGSGGGGGGATRRHDDLATNPNRHKTKISLVPRQLKASATAADAAAETSGSSSGSAGGSGPMSNNDFRNLLMRK